MLRASLDSERRQRAGSRRCRNASLPWRPRTVVHGREYGASCAGGLIVRALVVVDPRIGVGAPHIAEAVVPTSAVYELVEAGRAYPVPPSGSGSPLPRPRRPSRLNG